MHEAMKVLLVAPEICTPWSEGRKKWVRDLAEEMHGTDEVFVLTSVPPGESTSFASPSDALACTGRAGRLTVLLRRLPEYIRRLRPDLVCSFPYGTFRRTHGFANRAYMRIVDFICRGQGIPCLTLLYSIDEHATPGALKRWVSNLAVGEHADWDGFTVDPGVCVETLPTVPRSPGYTPTILFLTGLWQRTPQRVEHMLQVRGLETILQAGRTLCDAGVRLIAGAPLLADEACRQYLLSHPSNQWAPDMLEFETMAPIPEVYGRGDLFVFPYRHEIGHFVPTSVVEAMLAGTPVAVSDLPMLRKIAQGGRNAFEFANGDPDALAEVVLAALGDPDRRRTVADSALAYARERWNIGRSAEQIRQAALRMGVRAGTGS